MNTIDEGKETTTADAALDTSRQGGSSSIKKKKQRGSSIFQKAQKSFIRSGGQRGATVETLRGTTGADFEAKGRIHRAGGVVDSLGRCRGCCFRCCRCCCCGEDRESQKERLLLIKGPFCFVFKDEQAASPKYAIALVNLKAVAKQGHANTVELQTSLGDVQYEVVFDNNAAGVDVAKQFRHVVQQQAAAAETELVRKRLGHEHLLTKHSKSMRYAEGIAKKKVQEQPDAPISAGDIVANMPITPAM